MDNVDEWKWKLSMLLRNEAEQEIVSREKKDRRDYEHLAAFAERMGLYRSYFPPLYYFSLLLLCSVLPFCTQLDTDVRN